MRHFILGIVVTSTLACGGCLCGPENPEGDLDAYLCGDADYCDEALEGDGGFAMTREEALVGSDGSLRRPVPQTEEDLPID